MGQTTSKPRAAGGGDLVAVEGEVAGRPRQPVGGGEVDGVDDAHGEAAAELEGAAEAAVVDGDDGERVPVVAEGGPEPRLLPRSGRQLVQRDHRLGAGQRRRAPRWGRASIVSTTRSRPGSST